VITDSRGNLARKSAVPIIRIKPITDLDFIYAVEKPMKKTAIPDQFLVAAKMTANCEGKPAWFQERNFCSTV